MWITINIYRKEPLYIESPVKQNPRMKPHANTVSSAVTQMVGNEFSLKNHNKDAGYSRLGKIVKSWLKGLVFRS